MAEKIAYEVLKEGFLLGRYQKVGDLVKLSERQAEYFLPPHDDRLALPKNKPAAKQKPATES